MQTRTLMLAAGLYAAFAVSCRETAEPTVDTTGGGTPTVKLDTVALGQTKSLSLPNVAFPNPLPLRLSLVAGDTVDVGIFIKGSVSAAWLVKDDAIQQPGDIAWSSTRQQEGVNNPFILTTVHAGIVVPATGVYAVKVNPHCMEPTTCSPRGPFDVTVRRSLPFVVQARGPSVFGGNWAFWPGGASFEKSVAIGATAVDTIRLRNAGARSVAVTVTVTGSTFEITPSAVTLVGPTLPTGAAKLALRAKSALAAGTYRDTLVFGGIPDDEWHLHLVARRIPFVITVQ